MVLSVADFLFLALIIASETEIGRIQDVNVRCPRPETSTMDTMNDRVTVNILCHGLEKRLNQALFFILIVQLTKNFNRKFRNLSRL